MIHYHGTPCGGSRQDAARFLMGRHALVPFTYQDDMELVADVCQSFILDNGAFSVWKSGKTLDVIGYTSWCETWHRHPGFDWALIPDVIEGGEADNDAMIADWPRTINGVPVYHFHESLDRLVRLCSEWRMVALGSSGQWPNPGTNGWWHRVNEMMDAICDQEGRPLCRLHGLRMLNTEIFTKMPLASADSTNAVQNAGSLSRFGIYKPPSKWQRAAVIAERIERYNSAPVWVRSQQPELFTLESR